MTREVGAPSLPAGDGRTRDLGAGQSLRCALAMILNSTQVVKGAMDRIPWPVSLSISGLAFTLFFLQTGLDMHRTGAHGTGAVVGFTFLGLLYGTAGVALVALVAWALGPHAGGAAVA